MDNLDSLASHSDFTSTFLKLITKICYIVLCLFTQVSTERETSEREGPLLS